MLFVCLCDTHFGQKIFKVFSWLIFNSKPNTIKYDIKYSFTKLLNEWICPNMAWYIAACALSLYMQAEHTISHETVLSRTSTSNKVSVEWTHGHRILCLYRKMCHLEATTSWSAELLSRYTAKDSAQKQFSERRGTLRQLAKSLWPLQEGHREPKGKRKCLHLPSLLGIQWSLCASHLLHGGCCASKGVTDTKGPRKVQGSGTCVSTYLSDVFFFWLT